MVNSEILKYALKALARRDYSVVDLTTRLTERFGDESRDVIRHLILKRLLDDRRVAAAYVRSRSNRGPARLREELARRGIPDPIIDEVLRRADSPSLGDVLKARMTALGLRPPLDARSAARLFRHLRSLGFEDETIREELERFYEQQ